jgi:hypothetical protein
MEEFGEDFGMNLTGPIIAAGAFFGILAMLKNESWNPLSSAGSGRSVSGRYQEGSVAGQADNATARNLAQSAASIQQSAVQAGCRDFAGLHDAASALEKLRSGVQGGGAFSSSSFQLDIPSDQRAAVITFLRWDASGGILTYSGRAF